MKPGIFDFWSLGDFMYLHAKTKIPGMLQYINENPQRYISDQAWDKMLESMNEFNLRLHDGKAQGSEFLGWVDLPANALKSVDEDYKKAMDLFADKEAVVCVGIGGSYLGTRAVLSALQTPFSNAQPEMLYAGHQLDEAYHDDLLKYLRNKDFGIIVISKSGTTTEPAVAFRLLKNLLKEQGKGDELKKHIIAITDAKKGALRSLADELDLVSYVVPDDVGGRFSVLTPVGLVPLAVAGVDLQALLEGARDMSELVSYRQLPGRNPAVQYAAFRKLMWDSKKSVEILANTLPSLSYVAEWWKQLFGESEGKEHKGLLPANINMTSDLHSLGQFIQEGNPMFFETFLKVKSSDRNLKIPREVANLDNLNYLAGKSMDYINQKAAEGTQKAHADGAVPVSEIIIDKTDEYHLGQLLYFFEKACGMSAYSLGVNPFDQPGVEAYKSNMFTLLGKK